jgi:hypothetical protein
LSEIVFNGGEFVEGLDDTDGIISGNVVEDSTPFQGSAVDVLASTSLEELATTA